MSIAVDCPACGKNYYVKDEYAVKRFRCKSCEEMIDIPAEDLPIEVVDEEPEEEWQSPPPRKPSRETKAAAAAKPKKKKRRRSDGMPAGVIVAILGVIVLMFVNILSLPFTPPKRIIGFGVRIIFEGSIVKGLWQRQNATRNVARGLALLMLILLSIVAFVMYSMADPKNPATASRLQFTALVAAVQAGIQICIYVGLSLPSSADYFTE